MVRELRPHQREAIDAVRERWGAGDTRTAVVLATGTGKSDVIAKAATDEVAAGGRPLLTAHRSELLDQMSARCQMYLPGVRVGRVQAARNEGRAPITVAMAPTLANASRRARLRPPTMLIVDECFPAGTLVGGVPIESIRTGDYVDSWDELAARPVRRRVAATMRSRPSGLVRIETDRGSVVCTPGHPFLTAAGWISAAELPHGAQVLSFTHDDASLFDMLDSVRDDAGPEVAPRADGQDVLLAGVRDSGPSPRDCRAGRGAELGSVHGVHGRRLPGQTGASAVEATGSGLLLGDVQGRVGGSRRGAAHGAHEPRARLRSDALTQSDASARGARADGRDAAGDRAQAATARRERDTHADRATGAGRPARLADGGHLRHANRGATLALQVGHRAPDDEGLRRGGRRVAHIAPGFGRPAGRAVAVARVAGVQVLEPGRDGTYGGVCPGGVVYNLEVEGTHTYRVGAAGLVAHNCHHAASPSYVDILRWAGSFDRVPTLGLTATMVRGDKRRLGDVWQSIAYERDAAWAVEHGWLVRPRARVVVTDHLDLSKAKTSRGDFQDGELGEMVAQDVDQIAKAWQEHAGERITVAFTPSIAAGQALAQAFRDIGVPVGEVYGSTKLTERGDAAKGTGIYGQLARGETRVLVTVMVATEGWDCPPCSCVLVARPTKLPGLYAQMVGRGFRLSPETGKTDCLILDVVGASRHAKLVGLSDLMPSADVDDSELDALPCEDCGMPCSECVCEREAPPERDPDGGRRRLEGPAIYEDYDLFATSQCNWLFTHGALRFLPAGDRLVVLWPLKSVEGAEQHFSIGHCSARATLLNYADGQWLDDEVPHTLEEAKVIAERWAMSHNPDAVERYDPSLYTRRPLVGDVRKWEARIMGAAGMSRGRLADEVDVWIASRLLDQGVA